MLFVDFTYSIWTVNHTIPFTLITCIRHPPPSGVSASYRTIHTAYRPSSETGCLCPHLPSFIRSIHTENSLVPNIA